MYILFKCYNKPNIGKTVLCTVMYFIDFNYFELYGTYLTKETYIKSNRGIKPKHFRKITQDLIVEPPHPKRGLGFLNFFSLNKVDLSIFQAIPVEPAV